MTEIQVNSAADAQNVIAQVIGDLAEYISDAVRNNKEVHISLTGGRAGSEIAKQLFESPAIDSPLVHIWWSDERYLNTGNLERNDSVVPSDLVTKAKIHHLPSTDTTNDLAEAVSKASAELHLNTTTRFCDRNVMMDISLLSIGPDGHIASLFPGHSALTSTPAITGVIDSPKPPAQRLTWTFSTLNASEQIWFIATGSEKSDAVSKLITGSSVDEIPACGVRGKLKTVLYADKSALI
ncbi:MAG: hypothetical protein RIR66_219 [Actinomycetota bacterium]